MAEQERTRRAVLALGVGAVGVLAGCTGDGDDGAGTPTPTETARSPTEPPGSGTPTGTPQPEPAAEWVSFNHAERFHRVAGDFSQRDVGEYYLALLASADDAGAFPADRFGNQEAATLLTETDFSASVVVIFQDRMGSSHPDLDLLAAGRDGKTVTIETEYPGQAGTDDITTDTLVARISTAESVQGAQVTLHPQYGDAVRVSTVNRYENAPQFDPPGDLVVRNRDCSARSLSVTATYRGDLFVQDHLNLSPASSRHFESVLTHHGEWTVTVDGDATATRTWTLTDAPPGDVLVDVDGDGSVTLSHHPEGVTDGTVEACETGDSPYESSNPAENVDPPVDLWVLDRADRSSTLSVTVSDGDTQVFSQTVETRSGIDKIHRPGLLAKQTDYTVTVITNDGREATETVTVSEGATQLTVRVTASGDLAVSLN